jgi:hypothetical protein
MGVCALQKGSTWWEDGGDANIIGEEETKDVGEGGEGQRVTDAAVRTGMRDPGRFIRGCWGRERCVDNDREGDGPMAWKICGPRFSFWTVSLSLFRCECWSEFNGLETES